MKRSIFYSVVIAVLVLPLTSLAQNALINCNTLDSVDFESDTLLLGIQYSGIWEVGEPSKTIFNSSFESTNSLVTDLDSSYPINDTSDVYVSFKNTENYLPNYLGLYNPFEIEFTHRFITDSLTDYGSIAMSMDDGNTWYDVLSDEYNIDYGYGPGPYLNEHLFEGTGEIASDSLVISGDSDGWVHSKFSKNVEEIINNNNLYPDSIIVRFRFISDSIGGNEGWQIDNLCMSMDYLNIGIEENLPLKELAIYPNPNSGSFSIPSMNREGILRIYNLIGEEVFMTTETNQTITTDLPSGVYIITMRNLDQLYTTRMTIE